MNEERIVEVLAAHAEELTGRPGSMQQIGATEEERTWLAPLFQIAEQLYQSMQPVQPSATFVRSLRRELVDSAERQIALQKRLRRAAVIGAAAVGSLVSIASLVGAVVFVTARLRARAQARALQAPTG
ncbi:MAG: hypothetical protein ACE5OS_04920 [Anaerolineae bacterium]